MQKSKHQNLHLIITNIEYHYLGGLRWARVSKASCPKDRRYITNQIRMIKLAKIVPKLSTNDNISITSKPTSKSTPHTVLLLHKKYSDPDILQINK